MPGKLTTRHSGHGEHFRRGGCAFVNDGPFGPPPEAVAKRHKDYGMDWEIGNYAFGAAAGHPFLDAIIKNCVRAQQHPEWAEEMMKSIPRMFRGEFFVYDTTGPVLVSRTLAEYPNARDQVTVLFPEDVCDPNSWHCLGPYGVHLQGGTWRNRQGLVRRRLN